MRVIFWRIFNSRMALVLKYHFIQWKTWDPVSRKDIDSTERWYDVDIWTSKTKRNGRITSNSEMLSRKESTGPFPRLTILRREMTGDPGWKRNAWPIRLSPNTSTQLSRDSSCSWTRKKKSTQGNDASLISPFSFSFPLQNSCDPFEKNTRVAILAIWFQEKRKEETIQSWRRDERAIFRKRKIRSNRGRIYELGKKIASERIEQFFRGNHRVSRIRISKRR